MDPVAFSIFGIDIMWYAIIITSAMIIGTALTIKQGERQGFVADHILDIALVAIPLAIVGARLYYVLFNLELYQGNWMEMFNTRLGGMAIHGGLIGGFLGGYIVAKYRKMNILKIMDIAAPFLILSQAIGRWGNYINMEAYGGPTDLPWGILIDGVKVHPTFLYESLWNLAIFGLLIFIARRKTFDGQIAGLYMILYSVGRFFIEGLRTDSLMIAGLRTAQIASILLIIGGISFMLIVRKRGLRPAYPEVSIRNDYLFAKSIEELKRDQVEDDNKKDDNGTQDNS